MGKPHPAHRTTLIGHYVDVVGRRTFLARVIFGRTILSVEPVEPTEEVLKEAQRLYEVSSPKRQKKGRGKVANSTTTSMNVGEPTNTQFFEPSKDPITQLLEQLPYIVPGFVDSHVHIESSMLTPQHFADMVMPFGTVGVVTDPHEITNVLGVPGVELMMRDASRSPLKIAFGVPSCVPATSMETAGAHLGVSDVQRLMPRCRVLSEMMNVPGVLGSDAEVIGKLEVALSQGRPVDGHAPMLSGAALLSYVSGGGHFGGPEHGGVKESCHFDGPEISGVNESCHFDGPEHGGGRTCGVPSGGPVISTDHECSTLREAEEKIAAGMLIAVRQGSAARNFEALKQLFLTHLDSTLCCTDDAHPGEIMRQRHMLYFAERMLSQGLSIYDVYKPLLLTPIEHYKLSIGRLQVGDRADVLIVDDLEHLKVLRTYIDGRLVYDSECGLLTKSTHAPRLNHFVERHFTSADFQVSAPFDHPLVNVIRENIGLLITDKEVYDPEAAHGREILKGSEIPSDPAADGGGIVKIAVVNRYDSTAPIALGFIGGMGLTRGALGSSIAHDSHNVVIIGVDSQSMSKVANELFAMRGGLAVCSDTGRVTKLPLPIAGLMNNMSAGRMSERYDHIQQASRRDNGVTLEAPFMRLSFMSLVVIPHIKMSDKGLFDVDAFKFISLCERRC